jgi:hypothetical protein
MVKDIHLQNFEEGRHLKARLHKMAEKRGTKVTHVKDMYNLTPERQARIDEYAEDLVRALRGQG